MTFNHNVPSTSQVFIVA